MRVETKGLRGEGTRTSLRIQTRKGKKEAPSQGELFSPSLTPDQRKRIWKTPPSPRTKKRVFFYEEDLCTGEYGPLYSSKGKGEGCRSSSSQFGEEGSPSRGGFSKVCFLTKWKRAKESFLTTTGGRKRRLAFSTEVSKGRKKRKPRGTTGASPFQLEQGKRGEEGDIFPTPTQKGVLSDFLSLEIESPLETKVRP